MSRNCHAKELCYVTLISFLFPILIYFQCQMSRKKSNLHRKKKRAPKLRRRIYPRLPFLRFTHAAEFLRFCVTLSFHVHQCVGNSRCK